MNRSKISTGRSDWETPRELHDALDAIFYFQLDAACTRENCLAPQGMFWPERNGLLEPWLRSTFANPPFVRGQIGEWTGKALFEAEKRGVTTVMILPVGPETKWWRQHVLAANEVIMLGKRVSFCLQGKPIHGNGYPTAIAIWRPRPKLETWRPYRAVFLP